MSIRSTLRRYILKHKIRIKCPQEATTPQRKLHNATEKLPFKEEGFKLGLACSKPTLQCTHLLRKAHQKPIVVVYAGNVHEKTVTGQVNKKNHMSCDLVHITPTFAVCRWEYKKSQEQRHAKVTPKAPKSPKPPAAKAEPALPEPQNSYAPFSASFCPWLSQHTNRCGGGNWMVRHSSFAEKKRPRCRKHFCGSAC